VNPWVSERKYCLCCCSDLWYWDRKRLHAMLGHVARAKTELEKATRGIKYQLGAELDAAGHEGNTEIAQELVGDQ
jgi:hypothetical protein